MAESTSLIDLLMRRVLDLSLSQLAEWDELGSRCRVAVNLSARQLSDLTLPDTVADVLGRHGLAPERLQLEVTESRLMSDPSAAPRSSPACSGWASRCRSTTSGRATRRWRTCSASGRRAQDRQELHPQADETDDDHDRPIHHRAGHNLGLRVVAEGVEDQRSADALADMGCDMMQGYFIGRPARAHAVLRAPDPHRASDARPPRPARAAPRPSDPPVHSSPRAA